MAERKIKNMEELAEVCGLSRPTVSKYFHDRESVRGSTRKRIEAALAKYDYRPNFYAVNQNRSRTKNIGIVVPNLADPFFAEVVRRIEIPVSQAGYRPILLSSHGGREQENANLESLRMIKPAGVLLAPLGRSSDTDYIREFCREVPTVLIDCDIASLGEAFVGTDHAHSIFTMVEYLCRSGEPPIFVDMVNPPNPNAMKHRTAYHAAMERLGHEPLEFRAEGDGWDFEEIGFQHGMRLFSGQSLPTNTILCSNDRLAIGMVSAAYESGLKVGRDAGCNVRIAGHDDHPFARYTCPTLTTIAQDYTLIAQKSATTLLSLIESESRTGNREVTLFQGRLMMRGSA